MLALALGACTDSPTSADAGIQDAAAIDGGADLDAAVADTGPVFTDGLCGFEGQECMEGCGTSLSCVCALTKANRSPFRLYPSCGVNAPCSGREVCGPGIRNPRPFCHAESECQVDADCSGLPVSARCLTIQNKGVCIEVGEGAEGTTCEATEDCSLGNLCILGSCSTTCIPGGDSCQDGTRCVEQTVGGTPSGQGGCFPDACDPLSTTNTCAQGEQCLQQAYDPTEGRWLGACVEKGNLDCELVECDPGSRCRPEANATCMAQCAPYRPPGQTGCADERYCRPIYGAPDEIIGGLCDETVHCDLQAPNCQPGVLCVPAFRGAICLLRSGDATEGDRCESNALTDDRRCSQGLFCEEGSGPGVCRKVCTPGGDDCRETESCAPQWLDQWGNGTRRSASVQQTFGLCRTSCTTSEDCSEVGGGCSQIYGACFVDTGVRCNPSRVTCPIDQLCWQGNCRQQCAVDDVRQFGRRHPGCAETEVCQGAELSSLVGLCQTPVAGCELTALAP